MITKSHQFVQEEVAFTSETWVPYHILGRAPAPHILANFAELLPRHRVVVTRGAVVNGYFLRPAPSCVMSIILLAHSLTLPYYTVQRAAPVYHYYYYLGHATVI